MQLQIAMTWIPNWKLGIQAINHATQIANLLSTIRPAKCFGPFECQTHSLFRSPLNSTFHQIGHPVVRSSNLVRESNGFHRVICFTSFSFSPLMESCSQSFDSKSWNLCSSVERSVLRHVSVSQRYALHTPLPHSQINDKLSSSVSISPAISVTVSPVSLAILQVSLAISQVSLAILPVVFSFSSDPRLGSFLYSNITASLITSPSQLTSRETMPAEWAVKKRCHERFSVAFYAIHSTFKIFH